MAKKVYTSINIVELVRGGAKELILEKGDIITPMARDKAQEMGLRIIENNGVNKKVDAVSRAEKIVENTDAASLEGKIRALVISLLEQNEQTKILANNNSAVVHVDGRKVEMAPFPFEINRPQMDVRLQDVITASHGSPMGVGFMSLHKGNFPWKLTYDEIEYVIEGELHIGTSQGTIIGLPGDVIYIPKGTEITFGTPSWAKFLYVTYPAEWAE